MSGWARALSLAAVLVVMACLVPAATASLHAEETLASQFAEFKQKHGRVYGSAAEEAFRLSVFRANLFLARLHAAANPHATSASRPSRTSRARNSGPATTTARRTLRRRRSARECRWTWRLLARPRQRIGARKAP
ncbi:putative cysteine peptidase [Trypanosoma cruzi]|uniref:Putative cysteine peptidase n=1 Tax=Trypanosoma cruzi TaxID=5693 RepID=A0A2V2V6H8_TRYCR|nr:putative cysteine peptidase [Trypanosoma cruzi]